MRTRISRSAHPARWLLLLLPWATTAWSQKPAASADGAVKLEPGLYAVINTSMGTITAELFEKEVPNTVRNYIGLARGTRPWLDPKSRQMVSRPLYDNITFHRVIPDFMIQTGDPTGTGAHNCGFLLKDEIVSALRFDRPGRLAMANVGSPNTGACQFFITDGPYIAGNGGYTIFGQVVDGQKVVGKIARVIRDSNDKPRLPIKLIHVDIMRVVPTLAPAPSANGSGVLVNAAGDILTSSQVLQNCTELRLKDGAKLQPAVVDRQNGLAVLRSGRKTDAFAVFRVGEGVAAEEPVWAASGPGAVSAIADSHGDSRVLQTTVAVQPGNLGGPILDTSGNLAGILSGKVEDSAQVASLAIKATVAMGFLDSGGVKYTTAVSEKPADRTLVMENASQYTVELQCWK